ncbi:aminotransferase DegT, partial [Peptococcaceae bacterium SCADC1_2_3]
MNTFLPYGHQWVDEADIQAVTEVMRSDWLTQGPKVQEFEEKLANYFGAKYAVTFSSGTCALHAAYFAAGLKKGEGVITTPITFVATANAALFLGAEVDFVDIEPETANINVSLIEEKITTKTKVIAPVDFAGQPVDLDEIRAVAKKHNLIVIEDACHAIGSLYKGKKIGGLSDLTVFSFHPVKNMTTGEGGAVLTNSSNFYEKLSMFRNHGKTRQPEKMKDSPGPWYYEMPYLGNNYRLTDMQCALGLSQLRKLTSFINRRREIMERYN